jgi:hypothetical protein
MMKFPYGIFDFKEIVTQHYFYCDRTHFIRTRVDGLGGRISPLRGRPRLPLGLGVASDDTVLTGFSRDPMAVAFRLMWPASLWPQCFLTIAS